MTLAQVLRVGSGVMPMSGQIGHQQIGQVDQHQLTVVLLALDRQGLDDAIGVGGLHGVGLGRAGLGPKTDVAANDQDAVAGALETDEPLIAEVERSPAEIPEPGAFGNRDRQDHFLVVLVLGDLHEELLFLFVVIEREQAFQTLGILHHFLPLGKLLLLFFFGRLGRRWFGGFLLGFYRRFIRPADAWRQTSGKRPPQHSRTQNPHGAKSARSHGSYLWLVKKWLGFPLFDESAILAKVERIFVHGEKSRSPFASIIAVRHGFCQLSTPREILRESPAANPPREVPGWRSSVHARLPPYLFARRTANLSAIFESRETTPHSAILPAAPSTAAISAARR